MGTKSLKIHRGENVNPKPPETLGGNYDTMSPKDKRRIDNLFKKYPLKPQEVSTSISGQKVLEDAKLETGKRILTRMIVVHPDKEITPHQIIKEFIVDVEKHAWKMGYELDHEFPKCLRAVKIKKDPFAWFIFAVLKKNPMSSRDVYFATKGMNMQEMGKAIAKEQKIERQDFTKL